MTETNHQNPMLPYLGEISEVKDLANEIKLFRIKMLNGGGEAFADYKPGQFAFVSAFGFGEAPFGKGIHIVGGTLRLHSGGEQNRAGNDRGDDIRFL